MSFSFLGFVIVSMGNWDLSGLLDLIGVRETGSLAGLVDFGQSLGGPLVSG